MKNEDELVGNLHHYYNRSLGVLKDFGGPSIYFHIEAIKECEKDFLSARHIEMIYATLASWGMHRMGDPKETKAKLKDFSVFKKSIIDHQEHLRDFIGLSMASCTPEQYKVHLDNLESIYADLEVSVSNSTIVANSKTLAHIFPHLIPPIDRQYTIRFFTQDNKQFFTKSGVYRSVNLPQESKAQFADFKKYACLIKILFDKCDQRIFTINNNTFNTSYPKIIDNLIMAFVKEVIKPESN